MESTGEHSGAGAGGFWKWFGALTASIIGPVVVFLLTHHGSWVAHGWHELVRWMRHLLHG